MLVARLERVGLVSKLSGLEDVGRVVAPEAVGEEKKSMVSLKPECARGLEGEGIARLTPPLLRRAPSPPDLTLQPRRPGRDVRLRQI